MLQCVYFGDVGEDASVLNAYLEKNGAPVPADANTAEFMLEAIGAGSSKRMGGGDWHEKWKASEEFATVKREIIELKEQALAQPDDTDAESAKEYATPFAFQLKTIVYVRRTSRQVALRLTRSSSSPYSKRTMLAFFRMADVSLAPEPACRAFG